MSRPAELPSWGRGWPCVVDDPQLDAPERAALLHLEGGGAPPSAVPRRARRASRSRRPGSSRSSPSRAGPRCPGPRTRRSSSAAPRHRRSRPAAATRAAGRSCARWSSRPNQIVGTPAEKVTRSRSNCSYRLAPSSLAPGITMRDADQRAGIGQAPGIGVEHRHHRQHDVVAREAHRVGHAPASGACRTVERWW